MPRKGYRPTGYRYKIPPAETLLGEHSSGARVYAELANCPLYCKVRIIAPGAVQGSKRASFYLGWKIQTREWSRISDYYFMPAGLLYWAAPLIVEAYPSVEEATGLTTAEVRMLVDEQRTKRAAYAKD